MRIQKASRKQAYIRIGLFGASGSGKTYSALKLASGLVDDMAKVVVIDTERGSASLYAHLGAFSVLNLDAPFSPRRYMDAIFLCQREDFEVIIIDSISHEWTGSGGCLEMKDKSANKNDWTKWRDVTPQHNMFVDSILQAKAHVICCGRSKDEVVLQENEKGLKAPVKVGLKAVTRDGFDYEMTLCFDIDASHNALASKDRTGLFSSPIPDQITTETGRLIRNWINEAEPEVGPLDGLSNNPDYLKAEIRNQVMAKKIPLEQAQQLIQAPSLDDINDVNRLQVLLNQFVNY
jgi:GTPase SAR1 family protein